MSVASTSRPRVRAPLWTDYRRYGPVLVVLALSVSTLLYTFPFIWMLSTSLKVQATSFKVPPELWPYEWNFENYVEAVTSPQAPMFKFFANSLKVAASVTLGHLITCSLAAYAFARLRFPGRDGLFVLLLTSLMVPAQITILPTYILMRNLGWIDTHFSLIVPGLTGAFGVFLLRQFFLTIPDDLEDAARIDGAGPIRILWQVMIPLVGPGLSTLGIITFNGSWNSFFGPLIFLNSASKMTWPLGLTILRGEYGQGSISVLMAAIVVAVMPVFIVFLFAQRFIVEGLTFTGIK